MSDMQEHGNAGKSGLQGFKHLEALELLPLPICLRNGSAVDVEHASNFEFTAWLKWNGIPFRGLEEWTFDSKCAIINYALRNGLQPRLIAWPGNCSGIVRELFAGPEEEKEMPQNEEQDKLRIAIELLRRKPDATDEDVRVALGLKTHGVARFWKIKARDVLENGK